MSKHEVSLESLFFGTATVGERGQVVVPAEARKRFNIHPGDKMLVVSSPYVSGVFLCKIDAMKEVVAQMQLDLEMMAARVASEETKDMG